MQGQRLLLLFDACAITCGLSSTVLGVWGDLISFRRVLVFSLAWRWLVAGVALAWCLFDVSVALACRWRSVSVAFV